MQINNIIVYSMTGQRFNRIVYHVNITKQWSCITNREQVQQEICG